MPIYRPLLRGVVQAHHGVTDSQRVGELPRASQRDALDDHDRRALDQLVGLRVADAARLSATGRTLFASSRQDKQRRNDTDRLRQYLARWALRFDELRG